MTWIDYLQIDIGVDLLILGGVLLGVWLERRGLTRMRLWGARPVTNPTGPACSYPGENCKDPAYCPVHGGL